MAHHAAIFEAITGGLSEETTINIAVLKAHVDNPTSLMNRYFPSMANKIASKFEELNQRETEWGWSPWKARSPVTTLLSVDPSRDQYFPAES